MSVAVRTRLPPLNVEESLRRALRGASSNQALHEVRTMEPLVLVAAAILASVVPARRASRVDVFEALRQE
jgi:hypothetical protein